MEDILKILELLVVVSVGVAGVEEVRHELGFGQSRFPRQPSAENRRANENHPRPNLIVIAGDDHRVAS